MATTPQTVLTPTSGPPRGVLRVARRGDFEHASSLKASYDGVLCRK